MNAPLFVDRLVKPLTIVVILAQAGCAGLPQDVAIDVLEAEVADAERAFARTMAERDHAAFRTFLADDAVFFSGETTLRGKAEVAAGWQPFFEDPVAPFSWRPDQVVVLESGTLALSTGPVYDPGGRIVGRFNSIWRREAPGRWRVVFDKGCPVCPPD